MHLSRRSAVGRIACACAEALEERRLLSVFLVKDINTGTADSAPQLLGSGGGFIYLRATDTATLDSSLYQSDGTAAGTQVIHPSWSPLDDPAAIISAAPDKTFAPIGRQLWVTAGSLADARLIRAFTQLSNNPHDFVVAGGKLFFIAGDQSSPPINQLWVSDGTAAGTVQLTSGSSDVSAIVPLGGNVVFATDNSQVFPQVAQVFVSDGTAAGTSAVSATMSGPIDLAAAGSFAYFAPSNAPGIWRTDGSASHTVQFPASFDAVNLVGTPGGILFFNSAGADESLYAWSATSFRQLGSAFLDPTRYAWVNNRLVFPNEASQQSGFWSSDATTAGTFLLKGEDANGADVEITGAGSLAFFAYDDGVHGKELWKTDGTPDGTAMVKDIDPYGSSLTNFGTGPRIAVGSELFFPATDGIHGLELWKTDGTDAGTVIVKDINTLPASSNPTNLADVNGTLHFTATDEYGTRAWISDGTAAGTAPATGAAGATGDLPALSPSFQIPGPPQPAQVIGLPGTAAHDGYTFVGVAVLPLPPVPPNPPPQFTPYYQLWRLGPSGSDALKLEELPLGGSSATGPEDLGAGTLVFFTNNSLYVTDGTPGAATTVAHLQDPLAFYGTFPTIPLPVQGGRIFFNTLGSSSRLWTSDGTAAGTVPLATLAGTSIRWTVAPNSVFFVTGSRDLWTTDGTPDGSAALARFVVRIPSPAPDNLTVSGSHLFFAATDAAHGRELWAADLAGSISGAVFNDANHNGVRDAAEGPLAGATVYVDTNNNGVLDPGEPSVVTASDGSYTFSGLAPGGATVREVPPSGWRRTTPLADSGSLLVHPALAAAGPTFGDVQIATVPMNFDYLLTLAQHYRQQATFATGDVTGDGQVNFDDLLLLAQNYGHPLASGTMTAAAEDASSLLLKKSRLSSRRRTTAR